MMMAGVYSPGGDFRLEERRIPQPGAGEVQVQVQNVGICGSDLHYYRDGHIGDWVIRQPHVLGHEFSGSVTGLGEGVSEFKLGDRVAVEPCLPCGECPSCRRGRYNVCSSLRFIGSPHTDGAFQQYVLARPSFTHHLPENLDFELGALVEPTAVAVQAVRRARLHLGETVAIVGAGPIGLLTLAVARSSGARDVFVSDISPERLEKARALGASATIDARVNAVQTLMDLTGGQGVDVSFEAVGSAATINQAIGMTTPGGRLTLIGMSSQEAVGFNLFAAQSKELELITVWLYLDAFPTAIALLASGRVDARAIVTHRFGFEDLPTALETAAQQLGAPIKVMVRSQAS